jgi:hypothetical protein
MIMKPLFAAASALLLVAAGTADGLCTSPETNIFHVKVNLFASELGASSSSSCPW